MLPVAIGRMQDSLLQVDGFWSSIGKRNETHCIVLLGSAGLVPAVLIWGQVYVKYRSYLGETSPPIESKRLDSKMMRFEGEAGRGASAWRSGSFINIYCEPKSRIFPVSPFSPSSFNIVISPIDR